MSSALMGCVIFPDKPQSLEIFTIEPIQDQLNCLSFKDSSGKYLSCSANKTIKFNSQTIGNNEKYSFIHILNLLNSIMIFHIKK
jgi:hypothetical protein